LAWFKYDKRSEKIAITFDEETGSENITINKQIYYSAKAKPKRYIRKLPF
jgi:hypothetical protein